MLKTAIKMTESNGTSPPKGAVKKKQATKLPGPEQKKKRIP